MFAVPVTRETRPVGVLLGGSGLARILAVRKPVVEVVYCSANKVILADIQCFLNIYCSANKAITFWWLPGVRSAI